MDITSLANVIYQNNRARGWWDKEREKGTLIALMHSELSEALEGERKDTMDDHLPQYKTVTVELADTIIRILRLLCALQSSYRGGYYSELSAVCNKTRERS